MLHSAFDRLTEEELGAARDTRDNAPRWRAITPVPADAPELTPGLISTFAPRGFSFTARWRYHDVAGRLLGAVARFDGVGADGAPNKQVLPLSYCDGPAGQRQWRAKAPPEPRPLFGLHRLAARPADPVLVVEGEKAAGPADKRFPDYVAITSSGGANAASKADWAPLAGRAVTIWPDADEPGQAYAANVAELARNAGAVSVDIVAVEGFPEAWDLADPLPPGFTDEDIATRLRQAGAAPKDGPLPLFPPLPPAEPYPVEALGPLLSRSAAAIARKVQVPAAIAAQSVLAAAALAAQAHADVLLPYGQTRPLSLFFVTVAGSGDRKSTADGEALWPVRKREKDLRAEHDNAFSAWTIEHAVWTAEKKKIEGEKKLGRDERKAKLQDLGDEPERPLLPILTMPDPTIEGLAKAWVNAPAALGIFTAEGGQFIGGHGMGQEHRLKTAAAYSEIWDGRPIKRVRALDGVTVLPGRRLSMHLMVQQDASAQFLADPQLRDQGLLSRVLVAAPSSIAGSRSYREVDPDDDAAIKVYGARILGILEREPQFEPGTRNELTPRELSLTAEASSIWRQFYDHVEAQCGPHADLAGIQDFAAKSAEHAARLAGVLTIVADVRANEIAAEAMTDAVTLADWYVTEALRLQQASRTDSRLLQAQRLLHWLQGRGEPKVAFREVLQFGPAEVRTKANAEQAVSTLIAHGWLAETIKRPRTFRVEKGEAN